MRTKPFFMLMAMVCLVGWACRPSPSHSAPNASTAPTAPHIIFIMVDSVRSDHLSAYGYGRANSPTLEQLAAEGVVFRDASSAAPWTFPSNAAILTGDMPSDLGVDWAGNGRIPDSSTLLAEYLHEAGYATAGFTSAYYTFQQFGFAQGFDTYQSVTGDISAAAVNQRAWSWLDANWSAEKSSERPLFLYLYYFDPHSSYTPPPPYDTLYDPDYDGPLTGEVYEHGQIVVSGEYVPTPRDIEHLHALYDGEIRYWDDQFSEMLAYLDGIGLLDNSLLVMTSDHGQQFGEHGKWLHRSSLYEEVLRVPWLIWYPDQIAAGQEVASAVSLVDLTPTLLDLAGLSVPDRLQDQSLLPLLADSTLSPRPVYSELDKVTDPAHTAYWITPHTDMFAVKQDGLKYVHTTGATTPADELLEVGSESVYEGENVIGSNSAEAEALWQMLQSRFGLPDELQFLPSVVATSDSH